MGDIRDHGGNLDAQIARFGGRRQDWLDLSTGINPVAYPVPKLPQACWTDLPDKAAQDGLIAAARQFWNVPEDLDILAAPGASALISSMPFLFAGTQVDIPMPTYNEHAAAFAAQGWQQDTNANLRVLVHPNNPTGHLWSQNDLSGAVTVVDESFCDVTPEHSLLSLAPSTGHVTLKSFGKFWGLAGLRLGFLIASPEKIAKMREMIGPWAVSGPALSIGTQALSDQAWATETRLRLAQDSQRLDDLAQARGAKLAGGCTLFRLFQVRDAQAAQDALASQKIWSRIFPYSEQYLRLGLPAPSGWQQLEAALSKVTL